MNIGFAASNRECGRDKNAVKHPVENFIVFAWTTIGFWWGLGADSANDGDSREA